MTTEDRPTTWTRNDDGRATEWWDRWILGPVKVRMTATNWCGHADAPGWRFEVCQIIDHGNGSGAYTLRSSYRTDPLPTRELAQAAAKQWVREWAAGLIEAVGAVEDTVALLCEIRDWMRGLNIGDVHGALIPCTRDCEDGEDLLARLDVVCSAATRIAAAPGGEENAGE